MAKKMPLAERIEKLKDVLRRELARYESNKPYYSSVNLGYVEAMGNVLPDLKPDMKRNDIVELLRRLSITIEEQGKFCDYTIEEPDDIERQNRAEHMMYKRMFYQIDNLLKDLPKDKEFGDR